ncbi:MAG: hypothetical protein WC814_00710 [Candidatus Paceibacterota bacterium]
MTDSQPTRLHKRIGILILGHLGNFLMVYGYDFVVYPYLLVTFGFLLGWLYAVIGSIVLCLGTLWFYDVTKQDWLGIETIKLLRDEQAVGRARKLFQRIITKSDVLAFLLLSIKYDPFIVTVYMRRGSGNHVMSARDWKVFWASIVVTNVWWGLAIFGVIEIFERWLMPWYSVFSS